MVSRFDRIVPVLRPGSIAEWKAVLQGILHQLNVKTAPDETVDKFIDDAGLIKLAGHSGRSMETIIRLAWQRTMLDGRTEMSPADLNSTFARFKVNIDRREYERQTLLAIAACNDLDFIPKPGDKGYSYGKDYDRIIAQAIADRENRPLEEALQKLDPLRYLP